MDVPGNRWTTNAEEKILIGSLIGLQPAGGGAQVFETGLATFGR